MYMCYPPRKCGERASGARAGLCSFLAFVECRFVLNAAHPREPEPCGGVERKLPEVGFGISGRVKGMAFDLAMNGLQYGVLFSRKY
jgi:hypothetical protein